MGKKVREIKREDEGFPATGRYMERVIELPDGMEPGAGQDEKPANTKVHDWRPVGKEG